MTDLARKVEELAECIRDDWDVTVTTVHNSHSESSHDNSHVIINFSVRYTPYRIEAVVRPNDDLALVYDDLVNSMRRRYTT